MMYGEPSFILPYMKTGGGSKGVEGLGVYFLC